MRELGQVASWLPEKASCGSIAATGHSQQQEDIWLIPSNV
jgi:hypothetical protein